MFIGKNWRLPTVFPLFNIFKISIHLRCSRACRALHQPVRRVCLDTTLKATAAIGAIPRGRDAGAAPPA
jgi:hypothetical protein